MEIVIAIPHFTVWQVFWAIVILTGGYALMLGLRFNKDYRKRRQLQLVRFNKLKAHVDGLKMEYLNSQQKKKVQGYHAASYNEQTDDNNNNNAASHGAGGSIRNRVKTNATAETKGRGVLLPNEGFPNAVNRIDCVHNELSTNGKLQDTFSTIDSSNVINRNRNYFIKQSRSRPKGKKEECNLLPDHSEISSDEQNLRLDQANTNALSASDSDTEHKVYVVDSCGKVQQMIPFTASEYQRVTRTRSRSAANHLQRVGQCAKVRKRS